MTNESNIMIMRNDTTDYNGYQWNTSESNQQNPQTKYMAGWSDFVFATLFFILIVVTIVGNTLIIAAVITTRRLRSVTNCFVTSLAAADLLVGLAVMPPAIFLQGKYALISIYLFILIQLNGGSWELGEKLCDFWVSLDILLCTASILSLCAISIDRYLAVTQPLIYSRRRRSKRLAGLMIVMVWILAGAITSPPLLGCFSSSTNKSNTKCTYNMDSSYVVFSAIGSFFLPMVVMLYVYGKISCVIADRHRHLQASESESLPQRGNFLGERSEIIRIRQSEGLVTSKGGSSFCDQLTNEPEVTDSCKKLGLRNQQQSCTKDNVFGCTNRVARETKTAGTLAVVVGGFVACWLPFFILYLATPFIPTAPPDALMPALTWLGWINSAINPFIYAFYSADFRLAFWRLTCRKCCKGRINQTRNPATWRKKERSRT